MQNNVGSNISVNKMYLIPTEHAVWRMILYRRSHGNMAYG